METVIVAFENPTLRQRLSDLLESTGTAKCILCHSGDQVRRLMGKQPIYCVISSPHLTDGPAEWLHEDLPPACALLLVGPQHILDTCTSQDIFKLPTPLRKEEVLSTVRLLLQFGRRMDKYVRPRRSDTERELVDQAKKLLMARDGMTEDEAHRALQRQSMDAGTRIVQTARQLLNQATQPENGA